MRLFLSLSEYSVIVGKSGSGFKYAIQFAGAIDGSGLSGDTVMKYPRLRKIEEYVVKHDFVALDELCEVFGKSKNTIRRDVSELVESGMFEKVYGGVRASQTPGHSFSSFAERTKRNANQKKSVGEIAGSFVKNGDVIFIDSGTTVAALLPFLTDLSSLTIVTVSVQVLSFCLNYPNIQCIDLGGPLNHSTASLMPDEKTAERLHQFNIGKAFMGATGVSIEKGVTNQLGELPIKKKAVEHSNTCYLLVDSSKFDRVALLTFADLKEFDCVITDAPPAKKYRDYFRQNNIKLIAGEQGGKKNRRVER